MKLRANAFICNLLWAATGLAVGVVPAYAQQGVVIDWSTRHVIFSNPGTEMDALMHGRRLEWQRLVSNPRFRMQQLRRSAEWANRLSRLNAAMGEPRANADSLGGELNAAIAEPRTNAASTWGRTATPIDWAAKIAPGGAGTALGMFPAVWANFDTPSCSGDYVLFPVDVAGHSGTGTGQANFVGFHNLYAGTCTTGAVPSVDFAYYVGTGAVQNSPVLSLDGTKVAFVESLAGGSHFHVFTLGTTGGNGTAYNSPAVARTIVDNGTTITTTATNNATDTYVTMHGNVMVTRSSPFIDYTNDVAYVGDDTGKLHKFTGVFNGTLAEVTTGGWPFTVDSGSTLNGPVLDSTSGNIFVGGGGDAYCIVASTPAFCSSKSVNVSNGTASSGASLDPPIIDSTVEMLYSEAVATDSCGSHCSDSTSVLMQASVSASGFGAPVRVNMGAGGTNLHSGDFDNIYYNSASGTGNFYFCGNRSSAATPELYRVAITNGVMANSSTPLYQLVSTGNTGTKVSCTPLTEAFNGTTDFMFVGVQGQAASTNCDYKTGNTTHTSGCIYSFVLPSSGAAPGGPSAELSLHGNNSGASGIVIDNESSEPGASQIYFTNLVHGDATQAAQNGLD